MNAGLASAQRQAEDLVGLRLPDLQLDASDGQAINLSRLQGLVVIYTYPRTSPPDGTAIPGWSDIPGAKGCTPQSCGFRDHYTDLKNAGVDYVFGLSTQSADYQKEVVDRLHLPFALLSDMDLKLQKKIKLPIFEAGGMTLLHRLTMIVRNGTVEKVFGSISDPATNAADVLEYFANAETSSRLHATG